MKKILICICCVLCIISSTICCNTAVFAEDTMQCLGKSAILMDNSSGDIIYDKNSETKMQVASIVKLMTSLLIIEKIENNELTLSTKVLTSENASSMGGSQIFLDPHQEYTVEQLLKGIIVVSANDASVAMAEHIAGTEHNFVKLMNQKAKQLSLKNTLYCNSTGLSDAEQYSTAYDTALLLKEIHKHKTYLDYSQIWIEDLIHPSGRKTELVNTNKLIRYFKGCDLGKTGYTDEAGYCLGVSAQKNDMRLISVVLGTANKQDRFIEVSKMLNYGFSNFENKLIIDKNISLGKIKINMGKKTSVDIYAKEDYKALCKKGDDLALDITSNYNQTIKAPIKSGSEIGVCIISKNGLVIKEIPIVVNEQIDKLTYKDTFKRVVTNW